MMRRTGSAMAATAALALVAGVATTAWAINVGDKPTLSLKLLDGKTVTSEDLRGRMVILEFWATWCGPCVAQLPHLKQINEKYTPKGVTLISISIDDAASVAQRFAEKNGMVWPQAHDGSQRQPLAGAFGVRGIPHAVVISPEGEVLWKNHPARLDGDLDELLKQHPPTPRKPAASRDGDPAEALKAANTAIDAKDMKALAAALASLPPEAFDSRTLATRVRGLARRVTSPAVDAAALDAAVADQPEAAATLAKLRELAPAEAGAAGGVSPALAKSRLAKADAAREKGEHVEAYRLYKWVADKAEGDEQAAASERVATYEADEAFMAELKKAEYAEAARAALSLARGYEEAGQTEEAIASYEQVVARFADTDEARDAKAALARLRK